MPTFEGFRGFPQKRYIDDVIQADEIKPFNKEYSFFSEELIFLHLISVRIYINYIYLER